MGSHQINMPTLAKEFLDYYPIFIHKMEVRYLEELENQIIEFIEDKAGQITPEGMIITTASYRDLYDTLAIYIVFEIKRRVMNIVNTMDKDDLELENQEFFEIEVEQDGN